MTSPRLNANIINNRYVLFVGAGASAPLGLKPTGPFLELLPERVRAFIEQDSRMDFGEEGAKDFLGGLSVEAARHYKVDLPDSEVVLDYLNFLANVCRQMEKLPQRFSELAGTGGDQAFHNRWAEMFSRLQRYIQTVIVEHYSRVDGEHASRIYKPLFESLCRRGQMLPVFTTNYDWAFEHLAEASEAYLYLEDGFKRSPMGESWSRDVFNKFHPRQRKINIALFKLHGSTSWYRDANPPHLIRKFATPAPDLAGSRAVLIYPTQVKAQATQEEPFKTAYDYLRETMARTKLAVIIGFSFRDPAINDTLRNALTENSSLKLTIVEPKMNEEHGVAFSELVHKLGIEENESKKRLRVIKCEFGDEPFVCEEVARTVQGLVQWDNLEPWVERPAT